MEHYFWESVEEEYSHVQVCKYANPAKKDP